MSETQRKLFNRRVISLLIFGALVLLLIVFVVRVPSRSTPQPVEVRTSPQPQRVHLTTAEVLDSQVYYRTIIDNNLFRPLGWTPPRPQEPYRLLGTIIPTDAKTPPKAIIQNIVRNQTHLVTIGDTLDSNTYVTNIQTKHVTLKKNGQQRQLTLKSSFLQRR